MEMSGRVSAPLFEAGVVISGVEDEG